MKLNEESYAKLGKFLLDSDLLCGINVSNGGLVEGDYIQMWCTFAYAENWSLAMECTRNNEQTVDADIRSTFESRKVVSSIIIQLASSDNGVTFTCKTSLSQNTTSSSPAKGGETHATNIPHYRHSWNYTVNVSCKFENALICYDYIYRAYV